jgi:hypothetical protein
MSILMMKIAKKEAIDAIKRIESREERNLISHKEAHRKIIRIKKWINVLG